MLSGIQGGNKIRQGAQDGCLVTHWILKAPVYNELCGHLLGGNSFVLNVGFCSVGLSFTQLLPKLEVPHQYAQGEIICTDTLLPSLQM